MSNCTRVSRASPGSLACSAINVLTPPSASSLDLGHRAATVYDKGNVSQVGFHWQSPFVRIGIRFLLDRSAKRKS